MTARFIVGDTRDVTASLPDASVDFIMTSPPFLALRSYLPADHPDKHREIGSEATPAEFIDMLLSLTAEWDRVLAPHGSICVELGDTYSGSGGASGDYGDGGLREGQSKFDGSGRRNRRADVAAGILAPTKRPGPGDRDRIPGWPLAKCKALIPELYRIGLAYGINPLTGQPSPAGQWRVRNVVTWCRPNPPVGALGDKFRPATSDLVVACRSDKRWFDLEAVRTPQSEPGRTYSQGNHKETLQPHRAGKTIETNPAGAPPLDYWVIPPKGYAGAHYAVYPEELCRIPILSMCPLQVCRTCGEPRRRVVDIDYMPHGDPDATRREPRMAHRSESDGGVYAIGAFAHGRATKNITTLGWTDCGHDDWRTGVVYDPFAGSGTTLAVASGCGRDVIGADLDERNADLAVERCGMFLSVEHLDRAA